MGCCSLRVEHVRLHPEADGCRHVVELDFLGKDCIRYYNKVPVEKPVSVLVGAGRGSRAVHLPLGSGCPPSSASLSQAEMRTGLLPFRAGGQACCWGLPKEGSWPSPGRHDGDVGRAGFPLTLDRALPAPTAPGGAALPCSASGLTAASLQPLPPWAHGRPLCLFSSVRMVVLG